MPKVKVTKDDGTYVDIEYCRNKEGDWMITSREEKKMADVMVTVNGNEYSEEKFRKDLTRMLDVYRDKDAQMGVPECNGVSCDVCPLYKNSYCERRTTNSFKTIGLVYEWAIEHPVITNKDMLKKTFGKDVIHYIEARPYKEDWLDEEYKNPTKEESD